MASDGSGSMASCRGCWQPQPQVAHRLRCGDVFCGDCLASRARVALQFPAQSLPLRCCQQAVPASVVATLLQPAELAFYRFLTTQESERKREYVAEDKTKQLVAPCDFCGHATRLATVKDTRELLLDCGHVYCHGCMASMKKTIAAGRRRNGHTDVCCHELSLPGPATPIATTTTPATAKTPKPPKAVAAKTTATELLSAAGTDKATASRRVSARISTAMKKGDAAEESHGSASASGAVVVELLDDDDRNGGSEGEQCTTCQSVVDVATTRFRATCGHVFCKSCLQQRCQRALKNETQGGIGVPVRCCQQLVALDIVQPALTKREFLKYEALVAKRGDAMPPPAPQKRGAKRKADTLVAPATKTKMAEAPEPDKKRTRVAVAVVGAQGNGKATPKAKAKASTDTKTRSKSSAATPAGTEEEEETPQDCVACLAQVVVAADQLRGPCGHVYCATCLRAMAVLSLEDRTRVPIRCCSQEFPIEYVQRVLPKTKLAQYERFLREKDWKTSDLKSDREYAQVVKKLKGKQCPTCGIGVQKTGGCDAMRCLHGHHFCWKCVSAPCVCGRTRLEGYGWIPPAQQQQLPPTVDAQAQAAVAALAAALYNA